MYRPNTDSVFLRVYTIFGRSKENAWRIPKEIVNISPPLLCYLDMPLQ